MNISDKQDGQGTLATRGFWAFIATQFLGAFNDNAFKFLLIGFAMAVLPAESARNFVPLASALFILPFFLFSSYAGYLADKFSKRQVIIWTKLLEIAVMLAGFFLFRAQCVMPLLAVLFFMGAQSTFFSPAKYGYLPETLKAENLSAGNGLVQLFTFLAILAGGAIGGRLAEVYRSTIGTGASWCVAVAIIGTLTSLAVSKTAVGNPQAVLSWNPVTPHIGAFREMWREPRLRLSFIGNTYFWFMATILQSNIPIIVKQDYQLSETQMGVMQAVMALGIGVGSALAGWLSRGRVAFGFVIPGGIFLGLLLCVSGSVHIGFVPMLIAMGCVGMAAGFYQIPLGTGIQQFSPKERLGAMLGCANALDCISMILGTAVHWVLLGPFALAGCRVLLAVGCITLAMMPVLHKIQSLIPLEGTSEKKSCQNCSEN